MYKKGIGTLYYKVVVKFMAVHESTIFKINGCEKIYFTAVESNIQHCTLIFQFSLNSFDLYLFNYR